ncbi:uncharacterized protein LACBIDRAFT_308773 [Laccaria bicolor S238N-H82]|uniref:Predicted protein n=1 Tax=Laccaria bicolor (strain S238N-H82 / ATCC MYA-4686) TaxID=486041 RepID=B0CX60_LACBS|nr:uncharacterized protein LACBIDRAFT_308773 [Laccaria bicolor S238N-H82]EDR13196.1 predicted protein [Laccaria bicolor S238N-H82]|eukprot:XP_001875694.1 predicted protein [Laccaria bicolor S238N-H82]
MMHVAFATLSFTYPWYRVGEITSSTSSLFNGGKTFMIGPLLLLRDLANLGLSPHEKRTLASYSKGLTLFITTYQCFKFTSARAPFFVSHAWIYRDSDR